MTNKRKYAAAAAAQACCNALQHAAGEEQQQEVPPPQEEGRRRRRKVAEEEEDDGDSEWVLGGPKKNAKRKAKQGKKRKRACKEDIISQPIEKEDVCAFCVGWMAQASQRGCPFHDQEESARMFFVGDLADAAADAGMRERWNEVVADADLHHQTASFFEHAATSQEDDEWEGLFREDEGNILLE